MHNSTKDSQKITLGIFDISFPQTTARNPVEAFGIVPAKKSQEIYRGEIRRQAKISNLLLNPRHRRD